MISLNTTILVKLPTVGNWRKGRFNELMCIRPEHCRKSCFSAIAIGSVHEALVG